MRRLELVHDTGARGGANAFSGAARRRVRPDLRLVPDTGSRYRPAGAPAAPRHSWLTLSVAALAIAASLFTVRSDLPRTLIDGGSGLIASASEAASAALSPVAAARSA